MTDDRGGQIVRSVPGGGQTLVDSSTTHSELIVASPQELPSLLSQAKNLVVSVGQHAASGMKITPPAESTKRWNTCLACKKLIDKSRCAVCGCYMEVKSTWAEQKCPEGKW